MSEVRGRAEVEHGESEGVRARASGSREVERGARSVPGLATLSVLVWGAVGVDGVLTQSGESRGLLAFWFLVSWLPLLLLAHVAYWIPSRGRFANWWRARLVVGALPVLGALVAIVINDFEDEWRIPTYVSFVTLSAAWVLILRRR